MFETDFKREVYSDLTGERGTLMAQSKASSPPNTTRSAPTGTPHQKRSVPVAIEGS